MARLREACSTADSCRVPGPASIGRRWHSGRVVARRSYTPGIRPLAGPRAGRIAGLGSQDFGDATPGSRHWRLAAADARRARGTGIPSALLGQPLQRRRAAPAARNAREAVDSRRTCVRRGSDRLPRVLRDAAACAVGAASAGSSRAPGTPVPPHPGASSPAACSLKSMYRAISTGSRQELEYESDQRVPPRDVRMLRPFANRPQDLLGRHGRRRDQEPPGHPR